MAVAELRPPEYIRTHPDRELRRHWQQVLRQLASAQNGAALGTWLTEVDALDLAADEFVYADGANSAAKATLTAFARTLLDDGTAAAMRSTLDAQQDLDVPSQSEAEAGTATTERVWTAQRVKQAIDALATGGGIWEQIARSTFSGSSSANIGGSQTVDDYDAYRLIVSIESASADANVQIWASTDGGTTKVTDTSEITGIRRNNSPDSHVRFDVTGSFLFEFNTVDKDATNSTAEAEMTMYRPGNGHHKNVHIRTFWNDNGGPKHSIQERYTLVNNTGDIDSFIMEPATGNITGMWALLGLKTSA